MVNQGFAQAALPFLLSATLLAKEKKKTCDDQEGRIKERGRSKKQREQELRWRLKGVKL